MVIMMISENVHPSSLHLPAYPSIQIGILLTQGGCWLAGWLAGYVSEQTKQNNIKTQDGQILLNAFFSFSTNAHVKNCRSVMG